MRRKQLRFATGFRVALSSPSAQVAEMVIAVGDAEGGPGNNHAGADQWLFVISGTGSAHMARKRVPLRAGTLLLIPRRQQHEIRNSGSTALRTLNFYVPPAYAHDG